MSLSALPWQPTWELDHLKAGDSVEILDVNGFSLATIDSQAILENWGDTGARHWSERPGETYIDRPLEEVLANGRLFLAAPALLQVARQINSTLKRLKARNNLRPTLAHLQEHLDELLNRIEPAATVNG